MKDSRLTVIGIGVVALLVSGGAAFGSYFPNKSLYITIAIASVAAVALIFFGYTGHVVEKKVVETTKKPKQKKERKVAEDDPFEDVSSGRH